MTKRQLKLNLGCGNDYRSGYLNLDIDSTLKVDQVHDLTQPLPFAKNSISEILLQDILEHFTKQQGILLLRECQRILKLGGVLKIRVPDVLAIIKKYQQQPDLLMLFLYGETSKNGIWGVHKYGYDDWLMQQLADESGLEIITKNQVETNWEFMLRKNYYHHPIDIVCNNLSSYIVQTLYYLILHPVDYRLIWELGKLPPIWVGKLILRPLSRKVTSIVVKNELGKDYVKNILKYSHLRMHEQT